MSTKRKIGVTIGKFMPLHEGHELVIEFGSDNLDELHVLVSGSEYDEFPLSVRYEWVADFASNLHNVTVHHHIDKSPEIKEVDEHGTVLDPEFQNYWVQEFQLIVPGATHFLSSDLYGKTMSELLGIQWIPVDPNRETINISATKIRSDIWNRFSFISKYARSYFIKTVAVIGPESTGKSTLVKRLSAQFGAIGVHEYGRTISEQFCNDLNSHHFYDIVNGQNSLILSAVHKTKVPLVISDTESYTTYLFGKKYLNGLELTKIRDHATIQPFDLYILLAPTVEYIDDGTRILPNQSEREEFFQDLLDFLLKAKKNYVIIDGKSFAEREYSAIEVINKLVTTKRSF